MNEFIFTSVQRVFVRFLEEIEGTKKTLRNELTFSIPKFALFVYKEMISGPVVYLFLRFVGFCAKPGRKSILHWFSP